MANISDLVETYIKEILHESDGFLEIQRNDIASKFNCVPSQINYVIQTRFTIEKGYIVESKRGGGGYIRIRKVKIENEPYIYQQMANLIGDQINQQGAYDIIERLFEEEILTEREARLMMTATSKEILRFEIPIRDHLRAELLKAMISVLLFTK
ncbi:CtsR family transcriptional regulator [Rubeoparvulum massiliense]|uniref:CtsR family transcriptional regulator n=1 Tax=Rubeoparvulum massiliense TaxID=1631346 RepID=UPI00065E49A3|nr:CtsR family transcriptional regulator [Rubeoparvulum massiliense]